VESIRNYSPHRRPEQAENCTLSPLFKALKLIKAKTILFKLQIKKKTPILHVYFGPLFIITNTAPKSSSKSVRSQHYLFVAMVMSTVPPFEVIEPASRF